MPRGLDILVILFVLLLLFGARRLPELGGAIGKTFTAFKKETTGNDESPSREVTSTASTQGE